MSKRDPSTLTLTEAQKFQPWSTIGGGYGTQPYSVAIRNAEGAGLPYIQATHAVLHAQKSLGKLAAVLECWDHDQGEPWAHGTPLEEFMVNDPEGVAEIRAMSADLVTAALRLANLFAFSLAHNLEERCREKNGKSALDLLEEKVPSLADAIAQYKADRATNHSAVGSGVEGHPRNLTLVVSSHRDWSDPLERDW